MKLFENLPDYSDYLSENPIHELLGIDLDTYGVQDERLEDMADRLGRKIPKDLYSSVNPDNNVPFPAELDDLIRLHSLITSRKVVTILEFGVGMSTPVFDHALRKNEKAFKSFVTENLRRSNPFEVHSIDNNLEWIESTKKTYHSLSRKSFLHHCTCEVSHFNDRICTYYNNIPNVCPDFIYLDAPDQFSPSGNIRGINTRHPDRLPMSADILSIEHFLLPGTLLVVDGRTANARFLKSNLQRNWEYNYVEAYDQHFFEMKELPLGPYNKTQIEFCLGSDWLKDLS